jgi:hypothetical protein
LVIVLSAVPGLPICIAPLVSSNFSSQTEWFSSGTPVSPTNKNDRHDIADILLNVALNTINQPIKKRKTLKATSKINTTMLIY